LASAFPKGIGDLVRNQFLPPLVVVARCSVALPPNLMSTIQRLSLE
jgi:hypothetical protein